MDILFKPLHCGISVPDIKASIEWYCEKLGFIVLSNTYLEIAHAQIAFLKHGDFEIELFEVENATPLPADRSIPNLDIKTHGTKHIAFAVADAKNWADTLKLKGVEFAMELKEIENTFVFFVRDNSGNLIEFIERPEYFTSETVNKKQDYNKP